MRLTNEALLINASLNTGQLPDVYGVTPEMFVGYRSEYEFLVKYQKSYGSLPTPEAMRSKFKDFPASDALDQPFFADDVRHEHERRMLVRAVKVAATHLSEGDVEEAKLALSEFRGHTPVKPLRSTLTDMTFFDTYHEPVDALCVPWKPYQAMTGGIRRGDCWIMAARPNEGKSWRLIELARDALMEGKKVTLVSLEMPEAQINVRMHVALGAALGLDVDHVSMRDRIYDLVAYKKLLGAIKEKVPGEFLVHDSSRGVSTPLTVAGYAKESDLVLVDYVGLMTSVSGNRAIQDWRVQGEISNMLKEVALSTNGRVVAAAQINREGAGGKYPPKLNHLAGSDELGKDADVIITMKQYSTTCQAMSLEKNRHGGKDFLMFTRFLPNEGDFHEINREQADDLRDSEMP